MSDFVQFPEDVYVRAGNVFTAFDPKTSDFTIPNARAMMWFAQLAYEVDTSDANARLDKINRIAALWQFQSVTTFRGSQSELGTNYDTTGLVGIRSNAVLLAFAGTDPGVWQTLATDGQLRINPQTNTHRGFQSAFGASEVAQAVDSALSARTPTRPLFISGHSLGAALGILAARRAVAGNAAPAAVYGYGTPRVGDATFQSGYNAALGNVTYRLVHGRDLITRVPMSFLGYRHVGRVLACEPGGKFAKTALSSEASNDPDVTASYLGQIFQAGGAGIGGFLSGLFAGAGSRASFQTALATLLQPPGHGPLGEWFKFIPPPIRDHLQDRYIAALTG